MKLKLTCEYSLLSLDEALLVVELHAEVDEGEHGQVHQHALDQEGVLVALAVPGNIFDSHHPGTGFYKPTVQCKHVKNHELK